MDKWLNPSIVKFGMKIPKLQRFHRWILELNK